ncbi:hypothetical protein ABQD92_14230 [Enterococcus avium]|uniref:hypothetical protein n=1 Tax=Enterococcus avium TaxID=33945 RepID=UPI0032E4B940
MEENITIEFVKEWIDKHNLTKGSFDRIMNDLIYNSGHNYIDNPSLRYWLIDNTYKFRDMLPVELNKHQQVVLEWLKEEKEERCSFESAIYWYFEDDVEPDIISDRLTQIEFLQVLAAFAEWGNKSNE